MSPTLSQATTVEEVLRGWSVDRPTKTALLCPGRAPLSYEELWISSRRIASQTTWLGVQPEQRIALLAPSGPELALAFLGLGQVGVCAPLNPTVTPSELTRLLDDLVPTCIVVADSLAASLGPQLGGLGVPVLELVGTGFLRREGELGEAASVAPVRPEQGMLLLHTSGTTSQARHVVMNHRGVLGMARDIGTVLELTSHDRCLNPMPLYHIHGLLCATLASLTCGSSVVLVELQPERILDWMVEFEATWYTAVPTAHRTICELARGHWRPQRSPLRAVRSGSAPLPEDLERELAQVFGVPVIQCYGTTEAVRMIASNRLAAGGRKTGSVGRPMQLEVRVVDEDGADTRGVGQVVVRGMQALRNDSVPEGWDPTGDLGRFDEEGFLFLTGRTNERINRGGLKVEPQEVEAVLLRHPRLTQAVVFAVDHATLGQDVAAMVVGEGVTGEELRAFAADYLVAYKVPRTIEIRDRIPTNGLGKISRRELGHSLGVASSPTLSNPAEPALTDLWRRVLGIENVPSGGNFFQLGGDSLRAARLVGLIRQHFKVDARIQLLASAPTLSKMAAQILTLEALPPAHPDPARDPEVLPLTQVQQSFWLLNQAAPELYQNGHSLDIRGPLRRDVLELALDSLLSRHDVLRTNIVVEKDELKGIPGSHPVTLDPLGGDDSSFLSQPIVLEREPLLQARLSNLGPDHHRLLLKTHHAATDYVSGIALLEELATSYRQLAGGQPLELPAAGSHADFASQEALWLQSPEAERQQNFWLARLAGVQPLRVSSATRHSNRGGHLSNTLTEAASAAVRRRAGQSGCTVFAVCLSALFALLFRRTGSDDFCIGTPASQRISPQHDTLVGCLFNTVLVRSRLASSMTFAQLLSQVSQASWEALAHAQLPFGRVVRALSPERTPYGSPLVSTLLNVRPRLQPTGSWGDCQVHCVRQRTPVAGLDLSLTLEESEEGFHIELEYAADLFEPHEAGWLLEQYGRMLEVCSGCPDTRLADLPLYEEVSFSTLFTRRARLHPQSVAVRSQAGCLSYAELDRRSDELASRLTRRNLQADQVVAIYLARSLELPLAMMAVLKAGGAFLLLEPGLPQLRQAQMLEDARATLAFASRAMPLAHFPGQTLFLEDVEEGRCPPRPIVGKDVAYLMFTSGSTGRPKAVQVTHGNLSHCFQALATLPPLAQPHRFVMTTALSFDICLLEILFPLSTGGSTFAPDLDTGFDLARLRQALSASDFTLLQLTPSVWQLLLSSGWQAPPGSLALTGGEALSDELAARLGALFPEVWNLYGPTEVTIWASAARVTPGRSASLIGRPFPGLHGYVLDEHLEDGQEGELYLGGPQVARGYLDRPEQTAFLTNPTHGGRMYRTGDRVRREQDGSLRYLGRGDGQLKIRGMRVEPGEVEAVLREVTGGWAAVVASSDGQSLIAYCGETNLAVLRETLARRLMGPMLPAQFVFLSQPPLNSSGKLDRKALPPPGKARPGQPRETLDPLESRLLTLWRTCLKRPDLSVEDDFFASGGHSLLAAQLLVRMEAEFGHSPALGRLLETPNVRGMAQWLREPTVHPWPSIVPLRVSEQEKVRFYCVHPEGGGVLLYARLANLMGPGVSFYGITRTGGPADTLEQSRRYLADLLRFDPDGPFLLGGLSSGGPVAYEIGVQLARLGKSVPLVALFDSYVGGFSQRPSSRWAKLLENLRRLAFHSSNLLLYCRGAQERWLYLKNKLGPKPPPCRLEPAGGQESRYYTPSRCDLPVVLFRASHRRAGLDDPARDWRQAAPGLSIRPVRGYHGTDLVELDPLVRILGQQLGHEIDRILGPESTSLSTTPRRRDPVTDGCPG